VLSVVVSLATTEPVLQLKVVTVATLTEKLKVNGSVARACIKELLHQGLIKPVFVNNRISVYTRSAEPEEKKAEDPKAAGKAAAKKGGAGGGTKKGAPKGKEPEAAVAAEAE
jgi:hypothetical protein